MTSTVRGTALLGFTEFVSSLGLDPSQALAEVKLPADPLPGQLSGVQFNALIELCAQRANNPLFGLQFGLRQGPQGLGPLLYAMRSTGNLGEALTLLTRYFHVHSDGAEVRLERQAGSALLLYDITDGDLTSVRQTVELAMGVAAHLLHDLLGHAWKPRALMLRHAAAADRGAYRALLGVLPRFDSPVNAWVFDESLLATPLGPTDARCQQLVQQHIDELARVTLQELPSYVQKLLRSRLAGGQVTIRQVAEYMMISPRTLQRYLQAQGTGFQELLDKTRQAMAARYICDSSISLTQLASLLGYADLSAFSRAFHRWNGMSPQKWKQRLQPPHRQ
ncbi:AraC family transcriptional regulator [Pseudomonas chlororaphis]|uniref:AraC family transcriptional regulator n=1 Tax=Pseudomonas chlororaphis TaxID=587753 RepID=A0AAP9VZU5_9PSED|nr:AraC family transcriptional regulator [Pseudomonas chlororaphis]AUG41178.1 AraC family transcriptional regulator [Pseudomonas chlororaphis]QNR50792.1 AraC family transcriptional regulator [Pseudomonas chlororaphis]